MTDEIAESLRAMAQHRGLKLVKSRRRKPGTGDFGMFGLTDEEGTPLLGIGKDGLTANAGDIEAYLRAGATKTWQQSAAITPDNNGSKNRLSDTPEEAPHRTISKKRVSASRSGKPTAKGQAKSDDATRASKGLVRREKRATPAVIETAPAPTVDRKPLVRPPPPKPEPKFVTRQAKPGDSGALVKILNQLSGVRLTENRAAANLAALRKARGGLQVAEFGALVGCIAWIVVPTLQRGPVGRITVLVVDERHRRQGLGTRLLAEAEVFLAKKGCQLVELMAASDNKSSHAFLRSTGFEQENYRFARKITS